MLADLQRTGAGIACELQDHAFRQRADALGQKMGTHRDAVLLAPEWLGAGISTATQTSIARAASGAQALTLLLTAPEFMRR